MYLESCLTFHPLYLLQTQALTPGVVSGVFFLPQSFRDGMFVVIKMDLGFFLNLKIALFENKLKPHVFTISSLTT